MEAKATVQKPCLCWYSSSILAIESVSNGCGCSQYNNHLMHGWRDNEIGSQRQVQKCHIMSGDDRTKHTGWWWWWFNIAKPKQTIKSCLTWADLQWTGQLWRHSKTAARTPGPSVRQLFHMPARIIHTIAMTWSIILPIHQPVSLSLFLSYSLKLRVRNTLTGINLSQVPCSQQQQGHQHRQNITKIQ